MHASGALVAPSRCVICPRRQPGSRRTLWLEPSWRTRKVSVLHHKDSSMRHFALSRCRLAC
ncbi:hypothetical protein FA379_03480 [Pseudomonas aeruginosa]|nr:hypothetical protein [Pseudomonas aeruginosa]MCO2235938.1 hypothetical protein [Pseudomonas aeruginosa]MCO2237460.1 hypothetical protein [Pseudomonas aeruginosa]MCO2332603.1 hypothetical protein [Pseudomonas aeruginosa]MCO2359020.1 hypothetical protein [Pseudomonas aeruginosa]